MEGAAKRLAFAKHFLARRARIDVFMGITTFPPLPSVTDALYYDKKLTRGLYREKGEGLDITKRKVTPRRGMKSQCSQKVLCAVARSRGVILWRPSPHA